MPRVSPLWALGSVAVGLAAGGPGSLDRPPLPAPAASHDTGEAAPELTNASWFNTEHGRPVHLAELRGHVVLLNFWVFTCGNCTRSLPSLIDWDDAYRARGLTILGIHTPEFPPYAGEHDRDNVGRAMRAYGIHYPVAQDNDRRTWAAYGIRYWPSYVLIDRRGRIRYRDYGEFHLNDAADRAWRSRIEALLGDDPVPLHVDATATALGVRLTLRADSGARINARVKPALELPNGQVLRFDAPRLTPDSAYFAEAPSVVAPADARLTGATVRASICPATERYCREVSIPLDR
jgi:thiol-disulfide isomerase/thioredoxin